MNGISTEQNQSHNQSTQCPYRRNRYKFIQWTFKFKNAFDLRIFAQPLEISNILFIRLNAQPFLIGQQHSQQLYSIFLNKFGHIVIKNRFWCHSVISHFCLQILCDKPEHIFSEHCFYSHFDIILNMMRILYACFYQLQASV